MTPDIEERDGYLIFTDPISGGSVAHEGWTLTEYKQRIRQPQEDLDPDDGGVIPDEIEVPPGEWDQWMAALADDRRDPPLNDHYARPLLHTPSELAEYPNAGPPTDDEELPGSAGQNALESLRINSTRRPHLCPLLRRPPRRGQAADHC